MESNFKKDTEATIVYVKTFIKNKYLLYLIEYLEAKFLNRPIVTVISINAIFMSIICLLIILTYYMHALYKG